MQMAYATLSKAASRTAMKTKRGSRGKALLFILTSALDGDKWSTPRPGRFTPGKIQGDPREADIFKINSSQLFFK